MFNHEELKTICEIADRITDTYALYRNRERFWFTAMLAVQRAASWSIELHGLLLPKDVERNARLELLCRLK